MIRLLLPLFTVVLLFASCQKENLRTTGSTLLRKEVTTYYDNTVYTTTYRYNNLDKVIEQKTGANFYTWESVVEVKYDYQGRLSQTISYSVNDSNIVVKKESSYTYMYDNNNKIIKRIYTDFSDTTTGGTNETFDYDVQGRVERQSSFSSVDGTLLGYHVYKYDQKDNIVEERSYGPSDQDLGSTYNYLYDNNVRPYVSLGIEGKFLLNAGYNFSANNVIRRSRTGDEAEIARHETDVEGNVVRSIFYPENHPQFTATRQYFYQ